MPEYRRKMPHFHPEGVPLFLTWRLAGSLPAGAGQKVLKSEPRPGHAFVASDRMLDAAASGPRWLADPRIARVVAYTVAAGERERGFYSLQAWVIMPNHVHILITPAVPVRTITRWLKGSTARRANLILGLTGKPFWQDETWDHWIRKTQQLNRIRRYIEENPVSAGLCATPEGWQWSSSSWTGGTACPTLRV